MTYHYESLGDERFQQLAQALIAIEFPNVQCLPVGQPDGVSWTPDLGPLAKV